jgi:hypothetical protein
MSRAAAVGSTRDVSNFEQSTQPFIQVDQSKSTTGLAGDHNQIRVFEPQLTRQIPTTLPKPSAYPAFEEISADGITHFPTDCNPKPEILPRIQGAVFTQLYGFSRPRRVDKNDKIRVCTPESVTHHATKVSGIEKSVLASERSCTNPRCEHADFSTSTKSWRPVEFDPSRVGASGLLVPPSSSFVPGNRVCEAA